LGKEIVSLTFAVIMQKSITIDKPNVFMTKLQDYAQLTKMRLATLVVFSAAMSFLMAPGTIDWSKLLMLIIGGFLVTGSANGFNQLIERDLDKMMDRTSKRPLPDGRMSNSEGFLICSIIGSIGIFILTYYMNLASGILGLLSIILYTVAYTPLKKMSPLAVFVGAFPGAIPVLLGWVAATNSLGIYGWLLFSIQFIWQFPHFWAIAWVLDDDYKKAGFNLLPSGARDKGSAIQALIYTITLLPIGIMPFIFKMSGVVSLLVILAVTFYFIFLAIQLYKKCDVISARKLMYGSFLYLPVVQIVLVLDKL
jgi:protoheme IX farnesyltransferase